MVEMATIYSHRHNRTDVYCKMVEPYRISACQKSDYGGELFYQAVRGDGPRLERKLYRST